MREAREGRGSGASWRAAVGLLEGEGPGLLEGEGPLGTTGPGNRRVLRVFS